jgi:hypothetical protein
MRGCAVEDLYVQRIDAAGSDSNQYLAWTWLRTQDASHTQGCTVTLEERGFHGASAHEILI